MLAMLEYVVILTALGFAAADNQIDTRCFPNLGCFENDPLYGPPVQDPADVGTTVYLRNSAVTWQSYSVYPDVDPDLAKNFIIGKTAFIIHGYQSSGNATWVEDMTDALLDRGLDNVIAVDWTKGAGNTNYYQSVSDCRVIAAVVSFLRLFLQDLGLLADKNVTCIGHSLGAHGCGMVGKNASGDIATIIGLDPAGPGFEANSNRLQESDANFSYQLDTNSGFFGTTHGLTKFKFHANNGILQLDCLNFFTGSSQVKTAQADGAIACSHELSHTYFTQSLRKPRSFIGRRISDETILQVFLTKLLNKTYVDRLLVKLPNEPFIENLLTNLTNETYARQILSKSTDETFVEEVFGEFSEMTSYLEFILADLKAMFDFGNYTEASKDCSERCDCIPFGLETNEYADCPEGSYYIDTPTAE